MDHMFVSIQVHYLCEIKHDASQKAVVLFLWHDVLIPVVKYSELFHITIWLTSDFNGVLIDVTLDESDKLSISVDFDGLNWLSE